MSNNDSITQEIIKELLHYNPDTGEFTWKAQRNKLRVGDVAGVINDKGYRTIGIFGKMYKAHRLAWLYVYGEFPSSEVDHINRVRDDNRLSNLRLATPSQNKFNCNRRKDNSSGHKGVHYSPREKKWVAQCRLEGIRKRIGGFATLEEASIAYNEYAKQLHGEFYCPTV